MREPDALRTGFPGFFYCGIFSLAAGPMVEFSRVSVSTITGCRLGGSPVSAGRSAMSLYDTEANRSMSRSAEFESEIGAKASNYVERCISE